MVVWQPITIASVESLQMSPKCTSHAIRLTVSHGIAWCSITTQITKIPVTDNKILQLKSLPDLPLCDLVTLSSGTADETGHSLWRGSLVFQAWASTNLSMFSGLRLLELGAGCGASGIFLAASLSDNNDGERQSTSLNLTDGDPATLDLANEVSLSLLNLQVRAP